MRTQPLANILAAGALVTAAACSSSPAVRSTSTSCAAPTESTPRSSAPCRFEAGFPTTGFAWQGNSARLERRGPAYHPRTRLVVDGRADSGTLTEFLVDTGTSCAFLSSRSSVGTTAIASARRFSLVANEGATAFDGNEATLPTLRLGDLVARDVPVFVTDRQHDLRAPANVVGMAWLAGLSISHDARTDTWTLSRAHATPVGWRTVTLEGPAFPVLPVLDEDGHRVFALIDTGTPNSLVDRSQRPGRYRVVDADGGTLLNVEARDIAPWAGLAPRGRDIAVWIGLNDLSRASFTLDFADGTWSFVGTAPAAATVRTPAPVATPRR